MTDSTSADEYVADILVDKAARMLRDMAIIADNAGTSLNLGQILGGILGVSIGMTDQPITREEFTRVYDVFEEQFGDAIAQAGQDVGDGPEDAAHAVSREDARRRAEHWGGLIDAAAFDLMHPLPDLDDWEHELRGGINE